VGLYNRPEVAAVPGDVSPTPLIIIKKNRNLIVDEGDPDWRNV
jgi:hypothetical protein